MAAFGAGRVEPGGGAQLVGGDAGDRLDRLGAVLGPGDERRPTPRSPRSARPRTRRSTRPSVTTTCAIALMIATLVPGASCRWCAASMCGRAHQVDPARVDDDQLRRPARSRRFIRDANTGCAVGRVGADHHDHVGLVDRLEVLRAGRRAEGLLEAVAGRRVADPGAGVDVVVAERRAHHLLDDVDLFVGAARRRDAADRARRRTRAWISRNRVAAKPIASSHSTSRHGSSIVSRIIGFITRSWCDGVAEREPALDARVALVGAAVLVRAPCARPRRPASRP